MNFQTGQKVVCIRDANCELGSGYDHGLRNGSVYTIADFSRGSVAAGYLVLAEIKKGAWHPSRFRPVVERKTDISVFTKILDDVRKPVSVD